jgi:cell division septation protein DedD
VLVIIVGSAAGALYLRLSRGPIGIDFAVPMLERQIAAEMGVGSVKVASLHLQLNDSGRLGFGLTNLLVLDHAGQPLVQVPRAGVTPSWRALLSGTIAIERVDLVSPRMQAMLLDDGTARLSFARGPDTAEISSTPSGRGEPSRPPPPSQPQAFREGQQIDLVRVMTQISERARRGETSTAYLRSIGMRQATILVDSGSRKSIWRVPEFRLDLRHRSSGSRVSGGATVESLTGPWTVGFSLTEPVDSDSLDISLTISGLNPRGLARLVPSLVLYEGVDIGLSGQAKIELTRQGLVRSASLGLQASAGRVFAPGMGASIAIDRGHLDVSYDGTAGRLSIARAMVGFGQSRIELTGVAEHSPTSSRTPAEWTYEIRSLGGAIADDTAGNAVIPVDLLRVRGTAAPVEGRLTLAELVFRAAGTEITAQGDVVAAGIARRIGQPLQGVLEGRIGAMSAKTLTALWPRTLAPGARAWIADRVSKGNVTGGSFKLASSSQPAASETGEPASRFSLALQGSNVELRLAKKMPALEAPRVLVRLEGATSEVTAPDASIAAQDGRRVQFRSMRFTSVDTAAGEQPTGEIAFRVSSSLTAIADLLDREPLSLLKSHQISPASLEGKAEGNIKLVLPLADNVQASEIRSDGKLRISDLRVRNVLAPYDVSGGTFNIDLAERAIDIRGDLLVRGVNGKLNWQYLLDAPADQQPPLRLTATLDATDRTQLGIDVNDEVFGDLPIEVTVQRDGVGGLKARVRADLTKCELRLDTIAWKKSPGRAATFQFDPVRVQPPGQPQRIELQNVRLVGDDVAVEGSMVVGPDNKLREFAFHDFSVNVITRVDVQGKLRPDFVWEVRAKGPTFDGRDLFRSLFNVGQAERTSGKVRPGLDLVAEVDTVVGFADTSLKGLKLSASRRNEKFVALDARATHEDGKLFAAVIRSEGTKGRTLLAESKNAGHTFRIVGFYPNASGGSMNLEVALDGSGANERTGILWAQDFAILGDPVVSEVLQNADQSTAQPAAAPKRQVVRQQFDFERLKIPFSVGSGQFVFNDAYIRGPLIGATMRGKVDFRQQSVNIGGTYIPLSGLNSAIGAIPVIGLLLAGPQGEGVLGITFAVQGSLSAPQVVVNPFSLVTPGIFREIFQMAPEQFRVVPRNDAPVAANPKRSERAVRNSSTPAVPAPAPATQPPATQTKTSPPAPTTRPPAKPAAKPEVSSGWSSEVRVAPKTAP